MRKYKYYKVETDNEGNKHYYLSIIEENMDNPQIQHYKKSEVSEEVYYGYMREVWKEDRREERNSRCIKLKNGIRVRCNEDCSKCKETRSGTPLSIEKFVEDGNMPSSLSTSVEEASVYSDLLQELFIALEELDPKSRLICQLIMEGKHDYEIAEQLGYKARSTFSSQKKKLFEKLQARLKDFR